MVKSKKKKKIEHSPTLRTIKMVEDTLNNMDESAISISNLKKILPKKVNHNTLKKVLKYLDDSNKIVIGINGITWTINNSPKLKREIEKGTDWEVLSKLIRKTLGKEYKE